MNLHDKIMNLQCGVPPVPDAGKLPGSAEVLWSQGYKFGHRDARHAAAELALTADDKIRKLREALEAMHDAFQFTDESTGQYEAVQIARAALKETE
jgi:hypothetical protein